MIIFFLLNNEPECTELLKFSSLFMISCDNSQEGNYIEWVSDNEIADDLIFRGILLPIKKSVPIFRLGLNNILLILVISIALDFTKTIAFTRSSFDRLLIPRIQLKLQRK